MVRSLSSFAIPHFPSLQACTTTLFPMYKPLCANFLLLPSSLALLSKNFFSVENGGWRKIPSTYSPSSSKSEGPRWGRGNSLTEEDALHQQLMIFLIHSKLEGEDSSETYCCQAFSVPHAVLTHHIYHPACACRQLWAVTSYYG